MGIKKTEGVPAKLLRLIPPSLVFLIFVLIPILPAPPAFGEEIVIVSIDFKGYEDILKGFKSTCNTGVKEYSLGDYRKQAIIETVLKSKPKLILTVGYDALKSVWEIEDIPIISVMTLDLKRMVPEGRAVTGVDMTLPPAKQLDELRLVLPEAKRVGVIYSQSETGHMVEEAESAASSKGLILVSRPVKKPQDAISAIDDLGDEIDVLWLLPDITILNYEVVKYIMLFSYKNGIPIYAFSEKYVKNSALLAFGIDLHGIGVQAGGMANMVLSGMDIGEIPIEHAEKGELFLNLSTARKLKVTIPKDAIKRAKKVYGG